MPEDPSEARARNDSSAASISAPAFGCGGTATRAASIGTSVCAISSDASNATMIVIATCVRNTVMSVLVPKINRREDDDRRRRAGNDREPDFAHALERAFERLRARQVVLCAMSEHAFRHDDGVVDEHADREHQAHHRQDVERQAGEVQRAERDQQRERHRRRDDQRRRDLAQEQVQNDDCQQARRACPAFSRSLSDSARCRPGCRAGRC